MTVDLKECKKWYNQENLHNKHKVFHYGEKSLFSASESTDLRWLRKDFITVKCCISV